MSTGSAPRARAPFFFGSASRGMLVPVPAR
jgi:hypothetical protein